MSTSLDVPYYEIIAADIERSIKEGMYLPGDMLASEHGMAKMYSTSRVTVRKSLGILEEAGYIVPRQGKGYFVCKPAHENFHFVFSETAEGCTSTFRYIHAMRASELVAGELRLKPGQMVLGICRIIRRDEKPVAIDYKYIPHERGRATIESEIDYAIFPSIAATMAPPFALHTTMDIAAELPNDEVRGLLGCSEHTPLLTIYRHLYDSKDKPIGFGVRYQTPDYGTLGATSGYEASNAERKTV